MKKYSLIYSRCLGRGIALSFSILATISCVGEMPANTSPANSDFTTAVGEPKPVVSLGASVYQNSLDGHTHTTFAIWSPDTADVKLQLFGNNPHSYLLTKHEQYLANYTKSTVYYIDLLGNYNLTPYHFLIAGVPVHDPYARMVDLNWQSSNYRENDIVIDLSQTMLDKDFVSYTQTRDKTAISPYELSVRDFTISNDSGVPQKLKGTFAGLTVPGSQLNGVATGFDHIQQLGVSHVQIMPFFAFATVSIADVQQSNTPNSISNWGYDPSNYNLPEWRYSQYNSYLYSNGAKLPDPAAPQYLNRLIEVQSMVNTFHQAKIGVIMDVVYNHTYSKEVFSAITPKYYTDNDLSGVGNSLDVSNPMVSQMILDSLNYWVERYHIDGFRFDLMGVFPYATVKQWSTALNHKFPQQQLIILGEPWNGGQADNDEAAKIRLGTVSMTENNPGVVQVGVFNSQYRDALRGDGNTAANGGYIFNQLSANYFSSEPIKQGLMGSLRHSWNQVVPIQALNNLWDSMFAFAPGETINYVACHDNLNLWDKIKVWAYANPSRNSSLEYLKRIDKFATGIIYTSQGLPFIQSGDEMLRTKQVSATDGASTQGVSDSGAVGSSAYYSHNSYNLPDSVNAISWTKLTKNLNINAYYQGVIALRKSHPAFRMTSSSAISNNLITIAPADGVLITHINGAAVGDSWARILLIYNAAGNYTYQLPNGKWNLIMSNGNGPTAPISISGSVVAEGTAVTILYQE